MCEQYFLYDAIKEIWELEVGGEQRLNGVWECQESQIRFD